ncbi:unnamed protein product, partial [Mesorhabditis belari]|uniref:Uncharacterized protein n=1 Tax=Mesorhabditis belari TaxID=2138241 RepID=A0AAF3EBD1_9BILA
MTNKQKKQNVGIQSADGRNVDSGRTTDSEKSKNLHRPTKEAPTSKQPVREAATSKRRSNGFWLFAVIRRLIRWFFFFGVVVLSVATITILMNCADGGKQIVSSKPLCADLTRLSQFTKPSDKFSSNVYSTYSTVIRGYRNKSQQVYNNFARSEWGSVVHKWFHIVHSKVVEWSLLIWRHLNNIFDAVNDWYKREGEKTFGGFVNGCKLVLKMVWEVAKDVTTLCLELLSSAYLRCKNFMGTAQTAGFSKAFEELLRH